MPIKYVVCDWNGTLFEPPTDEGLNKAIGYAVLADAKAAVKRGRVWRGWDAAKLLRAKRQIQKRLDEYKAGQRPLAEVYQPFNELVLRGRPVETVLQMILDYAVENSDMIDERMMGPLADLDLIGGKACILSASQIHAIKKALENYRILHRSPRIPWVDIVANSLDCEDGKLLGMTLKIYGEKGRVFEDEFLRDRGFDCKTTVYSGDTADDLPVAEMLPRGHFAVPFYASSEFREAAASMYGAFVPKDQNDWRNFLLKS